MFCKNKDTEIFARALCFNLSYHDMLFFNAAAFRIWNLLQVICEEIKTTDICFELKAYLFILNY